MSYDYFSKSMMQYILDKIKPFIDAKVPSTRKVNNKALSSDISISASDVGAPALDGNNKVPIANTPSNYVEVTNDTARFALTTATVHNGMNVGVTATDKLYLIIDDTHLNSETGYKDIGSMSSVDWDDIQNKPDNLAYLEGASGQSVEPISPFLHASDIANNLTTTTPGKVLDATQGKALQDELDNAAYLGTPIVGSVDPISPVLYQADVVNNLVTNDSTKPLSAAMGRQLNSTLAGFVHSKFVSGTTDSSGRLFPDYSIADKVVVGLLPDEHGKIAQQFRLSSNKLGIRVLNSDAMTAYANSNIGVNVFYISTDYMQTDDSN